MTFSEANKQTGGQGNNFWLKLPGGSKNIKGSRNQDSTVLYIQFESYMIYLKYYLIQLTNNNNNNNYNNNTTLFYYASHTQQKLVSRWGVGKHITLQ